MIWGECAKRSKEVSRLKQELKKENGGYSEGYILDLAFTIESKKFQYSGL